ncbi:hypothetical protein HMPREF9377_01830 [Enterococcus faecalis R712]|nr:hypothetical protein HMPREF9377_01830 [Enterococcus faecalis R712]EFQ09243.1 hypothetical protein HMPREF9492_02387 [Enterococcus faecalis DAPTO 512]
MTRKPKELRKTLAVFLMLINDKQTKRVKKFILLFFYTLKH